MRVHHAIAIVAIILIGLGLKLTFFSAPPAEADARSVKSVRPRSCQRCDAHRGGTTVLRPQRLLALAAIYDGATRTEAAKIGGIGLQIIRD